MSRIMLTQQEAKEFDNWLMSPLGGSFTLPQLMELAGLTVATAIAKFYPDKRKIFIAAGPGNNGGDGIVAARHLSIFNYTVTLYQPPQTNHSEFFSVKHYSSIKFSASLAFFIVITKAIC